MCRLRCNIRMLFLLFVDLCVVRCALCVVGWLMFRCALCVVYCVLFVVRVVCCVLFVDCFLVCVVCCLLFVVGWSSFVGGWLLCVL